ncbi:hypothetical protein NC651_033654 [Populus alba x Populus x berolinensis]|nr:hypothetical protein NC651_033654 [Populus alba x Populus x berolinensis]
MQVSPTHALASPPPTRASMDSKGVFGSNHGIRARDKGKYLNMQDMHPSGDHLVRSGSLGPNLETGKTCSETDVGSSLPLDSGCGHSPSLELSPSTPCPFGVPSSPSVDLPLPTVDARAPPRDHGRAYVGFPLGNSFVNAWSESLSLENFPDFNFATSYHLMEMDPDNHNNLWKLCLIGYVAGKFLGFTALNKFIVSSSKCNVKLTMHDSSWLVFTFSFKTFSSKADKLVVLNGGLYYIFGRPLILKTMLEYFDFTASDMTRVPIWQAYSGRSHGEPCLDPMNAEVATMVDSYTAAPVRKRAKYVEVGPMDPTSPLPGLVPSAPSKIVHVIDDSLQDVNVAVGGKPSIGRKQYMTRSRAAATTNTSQHVMNDSEGSGSIKVWPMIGNRLQGRHEDSDAPSSSL